MASRYHSPVLDIASQTAGLINRNKSSQLQQQLLQARIGQVGFGERMQQERLGLQADRLGLQQQSLQQRIGMQNAQLQERIREFNETQKMQQQRLKMGMGVGRQSTILQAWNAAQQMAQQSGALNPATGKVDMSKMSPFERAKYTSLVQYAQKRGTDSYYRQQAGAAKNLLATFSTVNLQPIMNYAGIAGRAKLAKDSSLSALDSFNGRRNSPPSYYQYESTMQTTLPLFIDQLMKFLKTSVQPSVFKEFQQALSPQSWTTSPFLAQEKLKQAMDIVNKEAQNPTAAITQPDFYYNTQSMKAAESPYSSQTPSRQAMTNASNGQMTQEQAEKLAKILNMKAEQVKQDADSQ